MPKRLEKKRIVCIFLIFHSLFSFSSSKMWSLGSSKGFSFSKRGVCRLVKFRNGHFPNRGSPALALFEKGFSEIAEWWRLPFLKMAILILVSVKTAVSVWFRFYEPIPPPPHLFEINNDFFKILLNWHRYLFTSLLQEILWQQNWSPQRPSATALRFIVTYPGLLFVQPVTLWVGIWKTAIFHTSLRVFVFKMV